MAAIHENLNNEWAIVGCAVLSNDYLIFLHQQTEFHPEFDPDEIPLVDFGAYNLSADYEDRWGNLSFPEPTWKRPKIAHTKPDECVIADAKGMVFYLGLGEDKDFEEPIGKVWGAVSNLKNINGTIYGVHVARTLYKRLGRDKWLENDEASKFPDYKKITLSGFYDLDGFSENDIYCAGDSQDVWHFDGKNWKPLDICDGRFTCRSVCCAEDGFVYIGFDDGRIAKGRDDKWCVTEKKDRLPDQINSIVSYRGRVFIGTYVNTYLVNDDLSFTQYDFEGQLNFLGGAYLYSAYDKLLVANEYNQIAFYDGEKWLDINDCEELNPVEEEAFEQQTLQMMKDATEEMKAMVKEIESKEKGSEF